MKKVVGFGLTLALTATLVAQVSLVVAKSENKDKDERRPVTSPITGHEKDKDNKPGWGFGDKNHSHFGPFGHNKK